MSQILTVGKLRKILAGLADSTPVVVSGGHDHTYRVPHAATSTTVGYCSEDGTFHEWWGEESAGEGISPHHAVVLE